MPFLCLPHQSKLEYHANHSRNKNTIFETWLVPTRIHLLPPSLTHILLYYYAFVLIVTSFLLCFCVYKHGWFYLENAKIDEVASLAIEGILDLVGTQQSEALDVHSIQELHYHLTAMIQ